MFKKILAASAALFVGLGLSVVAVAGPASANHNSISASATCAEGGYLVTWSVVNSEVDKTETITESDATVVPVGTQLAPSQTKTFTEVVGSAAAKTVTLTGTWVDPSDPSDATKNVVVTDSGSIAVADFPSCSPPTETTPSETTTSDTPSSDTPTSDTPCIPNSAVGYTYDLATNSGDITVTDVPGSTGVLCHPFWVTATSWLYTQDALWPQVLDQAVKLPEISTPGVYHFAATVTCGQGDIYASFDSQPDPFGPMVSPGKPFHENFLHDMGFTSTGDNPWTYMAQPFGCNTVTPVAPTATSITECNQYGSVSVPADTTKVHYTVVGTGNQGDYVVTAAVQSPYNLAEGAVTSWTFHLGTFVKCAVSYNPVVTASPGECSASEGGSSKNVTVTFDNSASDVAVTFSIPSSNISTLVAAHATAQVVVSGITPSGGGFDVDADGVLLQHITIDAFVGCASAIPGDPSASPEVCTNGVLANGSITVDLQPGLIYSITGVGNSVSIPVVSTATTSLPAGDYEVSVVAATGYVLTGATAWPFKLTVATPEACGDFPTLSDQPVSVTSTSAACTADGSVAGTITVGQVDGVDFTQFVQYSIDGKPVSSITTSVAPGTHQVTARALGDNTLESGPNTQDGTAAWTVVIAASGIVCADLKTLALTGTNDVGWLLLGVLLLDAGLVLVAVRVVLNRRRAHRAS